jgi:hypothetical protein
MGTGRGAGSACRSEASIRVASRLHRQAAQLARLRDAVVVRHTGAGRSAALPREMLPPAHATRPRAKHRERGRLPRERGDHVAARRRSAAGAGDDECRLLSRHH